MRSIRVQLILVVLSMLLVWVAANTIFNVWTLRQAFASHTAADIQTLNYAALSGLRSAMNSERKEGVTIFLTALAKQPNVARVRVLDSTGRILFSSAPAEERGVTEPPPPAVLIGETQESGEYAELLGGERVASSYSPIRLTSECRRCHVGGAAIPAVLQLSMPEMHTSDTLHDLQTILILSTVTVFILVGALIWFASGVLISRPVSVLDSSMYQVQRGNLAVRAAEGEDEIGQLGRRFNYMVDELRSMQSQLTESHAAELERADRLATVGELAAGVAHEIKNPLAGISGAIEVVAADLPPDDPNQEIFQEVLVQIRRVDKTLRDLLNFARPAKPRMVSTDLNELVHAQYSLLRRSPEQEQVELRMTLSETLPQVDLDPDQIGQVVVNLLINALHAAAPSGTVLVRTGTDAATQSVRLEVVDSGHGVPPEKVEEIFKPFFTTKAKGTGLGLAISRRIVRAHGGDLTLAQPKAGDGACFVVQIPLPGQPGTQDTT